MLGRAGVGALLGQSERLHAMPPFLTGGSMVELVTMETATFAAPPARFEAGTQMVSQVVGLTAAAEYLSEIGMEQIAAHETELATHLLRGMAEIPAIRALGPAEPQARIATVSFDGDGGH